MDKVVHFEIPADDIVRARKFYEGLFGWKIIEDPEMSYHQVSTVETDEKGMPKQPGAINGGLMKRSAPGESPVIYIQVASIDEYLQKIPSAGGKVVLPKQPVEDLGFFAKISDPEGNIIGLWQERMGHPT